MPHACQALCVHSIDGFCGCFAIVRGIRNRSAWPHSLTHQRLRRFFQHVQITYKRADRLLDELVDGRVLIDILEHIEGTSGQRRQTGLVAARVEDQFIDANGRAEIVADVEVGQPAALEANVQQVLLHLDQGAVQASDVTQRCAAREHASGECGQFGLFVQVEPWPRCSRAVGKYRWIVVWMK